MDAKQRQRWATQRSKGQGRYIVTRALAVGVGFTGVTLLGLMRASLGVVYEARFPYELPLVLGGVFVVSAGATAISAWLAWRRNEAAFRAQYDGLGTRHARLRKAKAREPTPGTRR